MMQTTMIYNYNMHKNIKRIMKNNAITSNMEYIESITNFSPIIAQGGPDFIKYEFTQH